MHFSERHIVLRAVFHRVHFRRPFGAGLSSRPIPRVPFAFGELHPWQHSVGPPARKGRGPVSRNSAGALTGGTTLAPHSTGSASSGCAVRRSTRGNIPSGLRPERAGVPSAATAPELVARATCLPAGRLVARRGDPHRLRLRRAASCPPYLFAFGSRLRLRLPASPPAAGFAFGYAVASRRARPACQAAVASWLLRSHLRPFIRLAPDAPGCPDRPRNKVPPYKGPVASFVRAKACSGAGARPRNCGPCRAKEFF